MYKSDIKTYKLIKILKAFSMMELMVCVVAVTIMASVLVPTITQKAKKPDVRINANQLSKNCSAYGTDCHLCYPSKCVVCQKDCGTFENLNVEECKCKDGSSGGTSTPANTCAAGTYKSGSSCLACSGKNSYGLSNQYSSAGATSCSTCPENQMSNSTKTGCEDILQGCSQLAPNPISSSCYPICLSCGSNSASNSVMPCNGTTTFSLYCHNTPAVTCAANEIKMPDGSCMDSETVWPGCAELSYSCGELPYCKSCRAGYSAGVSWWPCGSNTVSCVRCN